MAKVFKWRVEREMSPTIDYRVVETQFGDGYKQTSADGINIKNESYAVKINAYEKEAGEIMAFFDEHQGWKSFLWKPPLGQLALYTCVDPKPNPQGGGLFVINATFVKSYSSIS